jgi:hypothetical protein
MSLRNPALSAIIIGLLAPALTAGGAAPEPGWPRICKQSALVAAIRIIDNACEDLKNCDHRKLEKLNTDVDKPMLLAALRNQYLQPLHVFFGRGVSDIKQSVNWNGGKKTQVDSLKFLGDPDGSVVYIIGQASTVPPRNANINPHQYNFTLSQDRMFSVMQYLEKELGVKCAGFRGGWLGDDIFQLDKSDAATLGIEPSEYGSDKDNLNQSVHIFVFPCASLLPVRPH